MRYMLLIYGPEDAMAPSGEDVDAAPWLAYTRSLVDAGMFVAGDPLATIAAATSVRIRDGRTMITDGPFAETKEVLGGYYVIECDDLDAALAAAARCPGAEYGTIEVRPLGELPAGAGAA